MKKYLLLSGLAICALLITGVVYAQVNNSNNPFIEKLAERFNLNIDEVQEFFNENKPRFGGDKPEFAGSEKGLDNLVEQGKITEDQKELIIEKHETIKETMNGLKDLSLKEMQEKMRGLGEEMNQWAEENGIDISFMGPMGGPKKDMHGGRRYPYQETE
ncbi:hypothetical protein KKC65_01005 [Patescibacteria group bacterium]|nr:hypothetical protein [Patescibacteria group bacterium]